MTTHSSERQEVMRQVGNKIIDACGEKLDITETVGVLLGLIVSYVALDIPGQGNQAGAIENICNEICRLHAEISAEAES